jgi:integrase
LEIKLRHIWTDEDRHGHTRYYVKKPGEKKIRLRAAPGTDKFIAEYNSALNGRSLHEEEQAKLTDRPVPRLPAADDSFRRHVELYYQSRDTFLTLDEHTTRAKRRKALDALCAEPTSDDDPTPIGSLPFALLTPDAIRGLRDRKKTPDSANERLKAIKALCTWAVSERKLAMNPARDVPYLKTDGDGSHTWTDDEVIQFKERWSLGTRPHLVLTVALLTGARRSDMYAFGKPHIRAAHQMSPEMQEIHPGRWLSFRQFKGRKKNPVDLVIPILPDLEEVLAASPLGEMTWITHSGGRGFKSSNALGTWFRRRANEAGLPHCSLHGLRKAGATQAANRGATAHQLMAIFGWKKISQAEVYTKKAEQQRMAAMGMGLLGTAKNTHFLHPSKKVGVSERKGQ